MEVVGKEIEKIDGLSLVLGKKAYTDDYSRKNCLIVKILRGAQSFENIESINISEAIKVKGIECIVVNNKIKNDRLDSNSFNPIHENDIAIIAGENEEVVVKAKSLIRIIYKNENNKSEKEDIKVAFKYDDVEKAFKNSNVILEQGYRLNNNYNGFMETNRSFTYLDQYERLVVITSTEVPFHIKAELIQHLNIPSGKIRVIATKTGGGYGGKQKLSSEYYASTITLKTGKAAKIIYSTNEQFNIDEKSQIIAKVKIGASYSGKINVIELDVKGQINYLYEKDSNLFVNAISELFSLYNLEAAGYRGQYSVYEYIENNKREDFSELVFIIESAVNLISEKLNIDPSLIREKSIVKKGDKQVIFKDLPDKCSEYIVDSDICRLIKEGKKNFLWDEKYTRNKIEKNKYKGIGMAIARQDIGLPKEDSATASIKFHEDGTFMLTLSTNYLGIGSETILAQICSEAIGVSVDKITVVSCDTDIVPFLSNTCSTSTLYSLGACVKKNGEKMKQAILKQAAVFLDSEEDIVVLNDEEIRCTKSNKCIAWKEFGKGCVMAQNHIFTCESHSFKKSSEAYMAGFAEVEVDICTGKIFVNRFLGVLDIGTCINPLITKVQVEGNIVRGIGSAITEEVKKYSDTQLTYSIPTRCDFGNLETHFIDGNTNSELYGARSIGELGFNVVAPAIKNAIYNATGVSVDSLPITPEKIIINKGISQS